MDLESIVVSTIVSGVLGQGMASKLNVFGPVVASVKEHKLGAS